jgi:hypothetical protein
MEQGIRRFEVRAERAAKTLAALAEEPDTARIALMGVLCAAAVCWFAVAWGDPVLLLALPVIAGAAVTTARVHRRRWVDEHDPDEEAAPPQAELDEWLARLQSSSREVAPILTEPARPTVHHPDPEPLVEVSFPAASSSIYEVREVRAGAPIMLEVRDSFDDAVDAAFELIEERDPPELEIVLDRGGEREVLWSYRREDAESERPRGTLDLFGFDATRYTEAHRSR